MSELTPIYRYQKDYLESQVFDLVVIGGGLNGAGIARDASERGLKVLLIDKNDFCSGTSSASTRLIHGGLRYLEYFEFPLVYESLREREVLLKNANHLVKPLEIVVPVYENGRVGDLLINCGLLMYDALSYFKSLPAHRKIKNDEMKNRIPSLSQQLLKSSFSYFDAQLSSVERLCIENILMAQKYGSLVLNYTELEKFNVKSGKIDSIVVYDKLSFQNYNIKAMYFVNVTGPWVDDVNKLLGVKVNKLIGATRGSHIVIRKFLDGPSVAIYFMASDGRQIFIVPWLDYYLVGTTDINFNGCLDNICPDLSEITYLIQNFNQLFPSNKIDVFDVLFTFSGIRPLPFVNNKNTSSITRRHIIREHKCDGIKNLISVIGGKLTTYRNLSELVTNKIFRSLSYPFKRSLSRKIPLIGSIHGDYNNFVIEKISSITSNYNIDFKTASSLVELYGSRVDEIIKYVEYDRSNCLEIAPCYPDIKAQIIYTIENEFSYYLTDILFRRTMLGFSEDMGIRSVDYILMQLKKYYSLSDKQVSQQIELLDREIEKRKIFT